MKETKFIAILRSFRMLLSFLWAEEDGGSLIINVHADRRLLVIYIRKRRGAAAHISHPRNQTWPKKELHGV